MTEELFREDATLATCSATVLALDEGGVILDRTVFYPQGGGQAGDGGALMLADGTQIAIIDARRTKGFPEASKARRSRAQGHQGSYAPQH